MIDPERPDLEQFPDYSHSSVYRVRLEAGDCLYLPSFWFHHLSQSHGCIGNRVTSYMIFDLNFSLFSLSSGELLVRHGVRHQIQLLQFAAELETVVNMLYSIVYDFKLLYRGILKLHPHFFWSLIAFLSNHLFLLTSSRAWTPTVLVWRFFCLPSSAASSSCCATRGRRTHGRTWHRSKSRGSRSRWTTLWWRGEYNGELLEYYLLRKGEIRFLKVHLKYQNKQRDKELKEVYRDNE